MKRRAYNPTTPRLHFVLFVLVIQALVLLSIVAVGGGSAAPVSRFSALPVHGAAMPQGQGSPTPTCQPGVVCATATATPTRCPVPPGCVSPSPTPTCQPGVVCATATVTPSPTNCGPVGCDTPTPSLTPTCQPGHCDTATPTPSPTMCDPVLCSSPTPSPTNCGAGGCSTATRTATPTVTCIPTPVGVTHWYPLDETSGSIANEVAFGANAFEFNGPAHVPGKVAGGLNFNGINQWAAVLPPWKSPQLGIGDFSIDTWISIPTTSLVGLQVFLDGRNFAPRGYAMFLFNGRLSLQMADLLPPPNGYSNYIAPTQGALANPGWHLVAATVQRVANGGTLWVDGVPVLTFTPRLGNLSNNAPLWIGRHHPNSAFNQTLWFKGSLDEIEFFHRSLTATEVQSLYNAGSAGKCKPPAATPTVTPTPGPCHWCTVDVTVGSTFYLYVTNLLYQGVVTGYACGGTGEPCVPPGDYPYYRPNANITRGQIAKVVALSAGFNDTPTGQTFTDVPPNHTFWVWIEQLSSRGFISGYACGGPGEPCDSLHRPYFRPGNNATRGQLAKIVANTAGINDDPGAQLFADVPPGYTFYSYINPLARRGVMSGYPCGGPGEPCTPPNNLPYFRPGSNVTRGQAAKIDANTFLLDDWIEP